jgi:opacity protein-like surface antigen
MQTFNFSRMALIAGGLCAGGLLAAGAAKAADRGPGWEFGADAIYQFSQDIGFEGGSRASLDDDLGLSISVGYRFNDKLEIQFGLDWQNIDYDVVINSAPPSLAGVQFSGSGSLDAVTPRFTANYNFMQGAITPYVSAGVGWSFIDTNIPSGRPQNVCWWDPWWGYICGTVQNTRNIDEFEYQVGAGVRWDIGPAYSMRFGYEKHWIDLGEADGTPDFDQLKVGFIFRY